MQAITAEDRIGTIPTDRPVTGHDLNNLREKLGLKVAEFCMIFGLSMNQWSRIKGRGDTPLRDPAIALYAILLDLYPELCPLPPRTVQNLVEMLNSAGIFPNKKELGTSLGREASSGYRWLEQRGRTPQLLSRIVHTLERAAGNSQVGVARAWELWNEIIEREASARGITKVMDVGNWEKNRVSPNPPPKGEEEDGQGEADETPPAAAPPTAANTGKGQRAAASKVPAVRKPASKPTPTKAPAKRAGAQRAAR